MEQKDLISEHLHITDTLLATLRDISRWSRFLSIIGFSVTIMIVILAFLLPAVLYSYAGLAYNLPVGYTATGIMVNMFILALLIFIPSLFLYKFATGMRGALIENRQGRFEESFHNLKSTFKFYGILAILLMGLYLLVFIAFAISTIFGG